MSSSHSGRTRQRAFERHGKHKAIQHAVDEMINRDMGKSHRFKIFRMGLDICAVCQRARAEHV